MIENSIEKPIKRGALRNFFGKEYFILRRRWNWFVNRKHFAKVNFNCSFNHTIINHKSVLIRPLKDVEMYLQHNKVRNLSIAIGTINKVVIRPGECFSLWRLVGRPTRIKGYLTGMTLHNGKIKKGTGGGLCQLGNLLYWMALHSPLSITERWRHSYDVFPDVNRMIPFACGATLSYNYIDLQITNTTAHNFQINLWMSDEHLNGSITCDHDLCTSVEIYETDHCFTQQWWGGYTRHNKIWKKITQHDHNVVTNELVTENNAIMMYTPFLDQ